MRGLKGRNVVVTGGASGIGQATAARFLISGVGIASFRNLRGDEEVVVEVDIKGGEQRYRYGASPGQNLG